MKKYLILALLAVTTIFLASCERLSEKIVVTIGMWPEASLKDDVNMYNAWKEAFEADHPEYEIKGEPYTYSPETFKPKANNHDLPTVFQTWFTEPRGIVNDGHAKDITEMVKKLGWYDKIDPKLAEYLTFDGKLYGIPRDGYGLGLVINLDVFEDAGLLDEEGLPLYPKTMAELRTTAAHISDTLGINGLIVLNNNKNGGWQFSNLAWNFGAKLQVQDENGKWKANLNDPGAVEALQMIKDMYWTDESLKKGTNNTYNDWHIDIASGTVGMAIAGNDALSMVTSSGLSKDKIGFYPMPKGGPDNQHQYTLFGGTPYMFSKYATDEEVEGALKFLEYIGRSPEVSKPAQDALVEGMRVASQKQMLILPSLHPWINQEYIDVIEGLEKSYVNVEMKYFQDFYDNIMVTRRAEEPHFTQEMYQILDEVLQQVASNQNADPLNLLTAANERFQSVYLNQLDK